MARIIAHCDPYNARMHYNGQKIVKKDGATPVSWVMGVYPTEEAAKVALWEFALEDEAEHFANIVHEDNESITELRHNLSEDYALTETDLDILLSWYKGEGVYYVDGHEPMLLKGGMSYSYDTITYTIE